MTKVKTQAIAKDFIALAEKEKVTDLIDVVQKKVNNLEAGIFRVVIVGEIKKGKSSFINALLGVDNLLPVLSDVATSTVFKVMYGTEKRIKVFFHPKDDQEVAPEPLLISEKDIPLYGTEDGNPNNSKGVDFIGVQLPNDLLKKGLVLIDTPGLGGIFRKHKAITWQYLPNADAVFFVLDSVESVATKEEMDMLNHLIKLTPSIFFVQTKIDLVNKELWQKWATRNKQIIADELKVPAEKLIYFPVSAKLKNIADQENSIKYLNRSGFGALLTFIHSKLIPKKEDDISRNILRYIYPPCISIRENKIDLLKLTLLNDSEMIEKLQKEYADLHTKLEKWKSTTWRDTYDKLDLDLQKIIQQARNRYLEELDPSPNSPIVANIIHSLEASYITSEDIVRDADSIISSCQEHCFEIINDVHNQFNAEVTQAISSTNSSLNDSVLEITNTGSLSNLELSAVNNLNIKNDWFDDAKSMTYGGLAGSMIGSIGVATLSVLFPPIAVIAGIAAVGGFLFGGYKGFENAEKRKKNEVIQQLKNVLSDAVRKAQSSTVRHFDGISNETRHAVGQQLKTQLEKVDQELKEKSKVLSDKRIETKQESDAKASALKKDIDHVERIIADILNILQPTTKNVA